MNPGTRSARRADCTCPVGVWTISEHNLESLSPSPDYHLVSQGEVRVEFAADGTMTYTAQDLRYDGPVREVGRGSSLIIFGHSITRSYTGRYRWAVERGTITISELEPLRIVEVTSEWNRGALGTNYASRRPRTSETPSHNLGGRPMKYNCEGNALYITPPVNRVDLSRVWVDGEHELRYPHYGVFVRP